MNYISEITGSEVVTLASLKLHLKVSSTTENDLLTSYIVACREYVEKYLNRALVKQTVTMVLDTFPTVNYINLRLTPIISLTSLKYYIDEVETSFTDVTIDTVSKPSRLNLTLDNSFPSVDNIRSVIKVVYVAGYSDVVNCPDVYKNAIMLMAADMYANRENPTRQYKTLADKLLGFYKCFDCLSICCSFGLILMDI